MLATGSPVGDERERQLELLAERITWGEPTDAAWARIERARRLFETGDYDAALADLDVAEPWFLSAGAARGVGEARLVRGNVWLERGAYEEAARCFTAARASFEEGGEPTRAAAARHNLGLVHWRIGDLGLAREEFVAAAEVFAGVGDQRSTGNTYNSLGLIAEEEGDFDAALAWYGAALPVLRAVGADSYVANALANTASVHERRGSLEVARDYQARALEVRQRIGHRRGTVGSRVELGRICLGLGDLDRAEAELSAARPDAEALGLRKHLADILGLEARLAAARGQWEAAWLKEVQASAARHELASAETARRIAEIRARAEREEVRREMARGAAENQLLRDARRQAESASRAKGEFLAVLSHEIRSPLTTVVGASELLASTALDTRQRELVHGIVAAGKAVVGVLDEILEVSRIEAGRVELAEEAFDLVALLDDLDAVGRTGAAAAGIRYVSERRVGGRWRTGDLGRVRQVALNLIGNAIKFTPTGTVSLRVDARGAEVVFEVEDTGVGIPADALERLFEPYQQANPSIRARFGGTGLGLAIARGLAERMGGGLTARSTPGLGSTFRAAILLPEAASPPVPARVPAGARPRVLLVEDEDAVAQIVAAMLEHLDAEVTRAAGVEDALEALASASFDLALVDVNLAGADGVVLTGRMIEVAPGLPVVGLTGAAAAADRARALAGGMVDYVAKPVTFTLLQRVLALAARSG